MGMMAYRPMTEEEAAVAAAFVPDPNTECCDNDEEHCDACSHCFRETWKHDCVHGGI